MTAALVAVLAVPVLLPFLAGARRGKTTMGDVESRSPLPGYVPRARPPAPEPERALAARLTHHLATHPRGREDRDLVSVFQAAERLKPSGYYGPSTALVLAERYGIVPPTPRYWTRSGTAKAKANYRARLVALAQRDPPRAEEWTQAASAVKGEKHG